MRAKTGILKGPHGLRRSLALFLLAAVAVAAVGALAEAAAQEAPDPGRATGAEIQNYRDQAVPTEYLPPNRGWYYGDVVVVTGLLVSGMWMVRGHRPGRWISAQLSVALLYLGLFRGGCICPVGATANLLLGLSHPELVGLATLALFLAPLVMALLSGRIFCGTVCPLGAVQQLLASKRPRAVPRRLHQVLLGLPAALLLATAGEAWLGLGFLPCRLDPYTPLFFQGHGLVQKLAASVSLGHAEPVWILAGSATAWAILAAALIAGWFVPRVFCRYLCPYSVLLGMLAAVGFWRRQIDSEACIQCNRCAKECPVQAIAPTADRKGLNLSSYQCVQCGRCSDVCKRKSV